MRSSSQLCSWIALDDDDDGDETMMLPGMCWANMDGLRQMVSIRILIIDKTLPYSDIHVHHHDYIFLGMSVRCDDPALTFRQSSCPDLSLWLGHARQSCARATVAE